MKIKNGIYFIISTLLCLKVVSEFKINDEKNKLNSLGNDLCFIISSEMGVNEKVISYLQKKDKDVKLSYASNQIMSKGEMFYFELKKKTSSILKNEEVIIYKNVILGAYSLL